MQKITVEMETVTSSKVNFYPPPSLYTIPRAEENKVSNGLHEELGHCGKERGNLLGQRQPIAVVADDQHAQPLGQGAVEDHRLLKKLWLEDYRCCTVVPLLVLCQAISVLFDSLSKSKCVCVQYIYYVYV